MRTFILTWNPAKWQWVDLDEQIARIQRGEPAVERWSTGNRIDVPLGSRVMLLRQGAEPRGLVGLGTSISDVTQPIHWDPERAARGERNNSVDVRWDLLAGPGAEPFVSHEELRTIPEVADIHWEPYSSGMEVRGDAGRRLAELVYERAGMPWVDPSELATTYVEGERLRVEVNRYERDRAARTECIEHHGTRCVVCGLDFGERYGALGEGFIHVHHLDPVGMAGGVAREVDPVRDLRPVCPNCHAMLHRGRELLSIDELRSRLVGS